MKFYTHFPRQVGRGRITVKSIRDLVTYVNKWNGKKDLYASVYGYEFLPKIYEPDYSGAIIDKIYWDLDPKDHPTITVEERTLRLSSALSDDSVPHFIKGTGTGFAMYGVTDDYPVAPDRKKNTVKLIQEHYDKKAGGIAGDTSSYGDISRITRIIGTLNLKFRSGTRRYCVFVSPKSIETGKYFEENILTGIQGNGFVRGNNPIELYYWESQAKDDTDSSGLNTYEDGIDETVTIEVDWYCVIQALSRCNGLNTATNRDRYIILSYLCNEGYTSQQARGIVKNNFNKYILDKMLLEGQLRNVFTKGIRFPSKTTMQKEGRCNNCTNCEKW